MFTGINIKSASPRWLYLLLLCSTHAAAELDIQQAVDIALQSDPEINRHLADARSWQQNAVAENQLPDPKLKLGLFNLPVDSFELEQEPMTQFNIGVEQDFMRGDTLELKQAQAEASAKIEQLDAALARVSLVRDVRLAYLDLYRQLQTGIILQKTRKLFTQLLEITQSQYSSGRARQQDVLQADLELARLQDREIKTRSQQDEARATLAQWLGDAASQDLPNEFPGLPDFNITNDNEAMLLNHPAVLRETASIRTLQYNVEIAEQQYSPGWSLGLEYRKRFGDNADGSNRADMLAVMASLDLPVFTENRQDRRVAASEEKVNAAHFRRDETMRKLKRTYQTYSAQLKHLRERQQTYRNNLLKSARNNTQASLNGYQSGVTEFNNLMRASITELDVMLDALRVDVDTAIALVQLDYTRGGEK